MSGIEIPGSTMSAYALHRQQSSEIKEVEGLLNKTQTLLKIKSLAIFLHIREGSNIKDKNKYENIMNLLALGKAEKGGYELYAWPDTVVFRKVVA